MIRIVPMTAELTRVDGSELDIVNAARVSFDKEHEVFDLEKDSRLIHYLARHNHWTPFGHVGAQFRMKAPIFVARQLAKHQVGLVWNEVSRRYVDYEPEFFMPDGWRFRASNAKQGSSEDLVALMEHPHHDGDLGSPSAFVELWTHDQLCLYNALIDSGVCPEQARMVLPLNTMTEWIWTGSLAAWARVFSLRIDNHTQKETRELVGQMCDRLEAEFPIALPALMERR